MKLSKLLDIEPVINTLLDQPLAFSFSYKMASLADIIERNHKYYVSQLKLLLEAYAEKDENGQYVEDNGNYKIKEDKLDEFQTRFTELKEVEVSDTIPQFTQEEFADTSLTPRQAFVLMPLFEQ